MTHKHHNQDSRRRRLASRTVAELAEDIAFRYLWDETKPAGEEAVPEEQWEAVLEAPCKGDKLLIARVCQYERWLRSGEDSEDPIVTSFTEATYPEFVRTILGKRFSPVFLALWDDSRNDWYPEEEWETRLNAVTHPMIPSWNEAIFDLARRLREARPTGRFILWE